MDKSQELKGSVLFLVINVLALIPSYNCTHSHTITEGEVVKLEFLYPCDSEIVTIQNANRAPFYISTDSDHLHLPNYQLYRFRVEEKHCSIQVVISPVKRDDEATYICVAYKDGGILELMRIRLNVEYPPGVVSCVPNDEDTVGERVPLHCQASVGSIPGEIICYQDSKRLPSQNELVQNGKILEQTIWVTKEYPVFCCSSLFYQPKDICDCKDFAWDPSGSEIYKDPCPTATFNLGQYMTSQVTSPLQTILNLIENTEDHPFIETVTRKIRNTSNTNLWVFGITTSVLLTVLVFVMPYIFQKFN